MKCIYCSYINPDDAKFCQQCGKPTEIICHFCGTHNASDAKFCKNCGKSLQESPELSQNNSNTVVTPPPKSLSGPASHALLEPGHSPVHLAGERRVVTVLFADVVDSTSLAEQMDAEDWTVIMNRAFELLTAVISRYEGTIARLMGDALLAFFGAPVAHEDDPIRAGRAALDLIEAVEVYADELRSRYDINFSIRVGLNTGPVVVGEVGSNLASEYTAMGDAVNLAARMQAAARPMTVLITEKTYHFLSHAFQCTDLGKIAIKGKMEPVHVFELGNPDPIIPGTRLAPGLNEQSAGMVGREKELSLLLQQGQAVQAGLGRAVLLVGEPGIGKSRLVKEWQTLINKMETVPSQISWFEGRTLSYGSGMPYHLLVDLMYSVLKIRPGTSGGAEALKSLQALCDDLFGDEKNAVAPFLGHFMSLPLQGEDLERLGLFDPQALQTQYYAGLRRLFIALAERNTVYIVLDDIQWADPSSIDMLIRLVPLVLQSSILFCIVSRPDREAAGWKLVESLREKMGASLTEINLGALSATESSQLMSKLLDTNSLPKSVNDLVSSSSDGNPLFVQEVVHMLVDRQILARQDQTWQVAKEIETVDIPDTLQSLLLARVDRLPAEGRQTLRVASVIGRQFSAEVLGRVLERLGRGQGIKSHLAQLAQLESSGLIALAETVPEIEYTFRHALIQDAVYVSLLKSEQRNLHLMVGEVLEEIYAAHPIESSNRLAEHFWQAGMPRRALPYFMMSAEKASRSYANAEAIENYSRAIRASEQDPSKMAEILRARGELYEIIGEFEMARIDQEKALNLSQSVQDTAGEWQALINLGALWSERDYQQTGAYYQRALSLARIISDKRILATSLNRIGNYYVNVVKPLDAEKSHREALTLFTELGDVSGIAETNDLLGMSNALGGKISEAFENFNQSVALFEQLGDLRSLSSSLAAKSILTSEPQTDTFVPARMTTIDAVQMTERSLRIAQEIGWRAGQVFAYCTLVVNLVAQGHYDRAMECMHSGAKIVEQIQHRQWQTYINIVSGVFYLDLFALEKAKVCFESALAMAELSHSTHWIHVCSGFLADTLIRMNDLTDAEALLENVHNQEVPLVTNGGRLVWAAQAELSMAENHPQDALNLVQQLMDASFYSGNEVAVRLWMLRAKAFTALAENEPGSAERQSWLKTAEELLLAVLAETQSLNYRSKTGWIHKLLAEVYRIQSKITEADAEQQLARDCILELAATITDPELRTQYVERALASWASPA